MQTLIKNPQTKSEHKSLKPSKVTSVKFILHQIGFVTILLKARHEELIF